MEVSGQLHLQGKSPWYPLDRRLSGPQNRSGRGGPTLTLLLLIPPSGPTVTLLPLILPICPDKGTLLTLFLLAQMGL